eukprot:TRINITY_DN2670_c0_g1_i2.p1 TRINITY_DN2670_c0_g1~~TRINITY_DN2670_c0_g1_i2.p1  ORF type:complete len:527 (+),score=89.87 TRINITY_DN2670_c0_g1_i2:60-1640(+)
MAETTERHSPKTHTLEPSHHELSRRRRLVIERKAEELATLGPAVYDPLPSLTQKVETSPRRYAPSFSQTLRFPPQNPPIDMDYDTNQGRKTSIVKNIHDHPHTGILSATPREQKRSTLLTPLTYDPDCGTKMSLSKSVEGSPRHYSILKAATPRNSFPVSQTDRFIDGNYGTSLPLAMQVEKSPLKYSNVFNSSPRQTIFDREQGDDDPFKYHDSTDYGHRATVSRSLQETPRRYASSFKASPRSPTRPPMAADAIYNHQITDISAQMPVSPRRYAVMKSGTARFQDPHTEGAGEHCDLNLDTGRFESVATHASNSGIRYASSFGSTPRFKDPYPEYSAKFYDIHHGPKKPLAKAVKDSPVTYVGMRSNAPRFAKPLPAQAPEVGSYATNRGQYADFAQAVEDSGVCYSTMKSAVPRFRDDVSPTKVGPGTYNPRDVSPTSCPMSAFASKTPRSSRRIHDGIHSDGVDVTQDNKVNSELIFSSHRACIFCFITFYQSIIGILHFCFLLFLFSFVFIMDHSSFAYYH